MAATAPEWISGRVTPGQMVSSWSYNLIYHCVPLQLDDATDTWLEFNSFTLVSQNDQWLQLTQWRSSTIPIIGIVATELVSKKKLYQRAAFLACFLWFDKFNAAHCYMSEFFNVICFKLFCEHSVYLLNDCSVFT